MAGNPYREGLKKLSDPPLYSKRSKMLICPVCGAEVKVRSFGPLGAAWYCTDPSCPWGPMKCPDGTDGRIIPAGDAPPDFHLYTAEEPGTDSSFKP